MHEQTIATCIDRPRTIIFVIDNSGSMATEIASVAANMNNFSTKIVAAET